jgi:hypothetical protein
VCSSSGVGELHCGKVVACEGRSGFKTLNDCFLGVFYLLRVFCIFSNNFKKNTAAKPFNLAHFAHFARVPVLFRCCFYLILIVF